MWGSKARRNRELERQNNLLLGIVGELHSTLAEQDRRIEELTTRRVWRAVARQADDPPEPMPDWEQDLRRIGLWGAVEDPTGETP